MNEVEFEGAPAPTRPRIGTVLAMLVVVAAILSYLGTYAVTNALIAAEVLSPMPSGRDPRMRWFLIGFAVLICLFLGIAGAARRSGARKLKEIEQMAAEDEDTPVSPTG